MFCTTCAAANSRNAIVCATCGADLGAIVSRPSHVDLPAAPLPARQGKTHRRLRRVITLTPLFLIILAVAIGFGRRYLEQTARADAYHQATAAEADGDYLRALDGYADAGDFRDAPERHTAVSQIVAPYRAAYAEALAALNGGRYDEAIDLLLPIVRDLPDYEDAALLLDQARQGHAVLLLREADAAEGRRDWLAAERLLADLVAIEPDNQAAAERLATIRRSHAPLVFTREGDLYLAGPDLADERLLVDEIPVVWPTWSPDRLRIAFVSREPGGDPFDGTLYVVNNDGTGLTRLAERVLPVNNWVSWSPDGSRIAFTSFADYDEINEQGTIAIHMIDLATGKETNLTGALRPHASSVTWSPTGDRIAFVSRLPITVPTGGVDYLDGDVYVLTLATGQLTNVTDDRVAEEWRISWSPVDDRLLLYTIPGDWTEDDPAEIFTLDLESDLLTEITDDQGEVGIPIWSPDGSRFAYVSGDRTVHVNSAAGDEWIRVADPIDQYLTWSPDGSALFAPASGQGSSYLLPLDDDFGARIPLDLPFDQGRTETGAPQWSPRYMK